MAFSTSKRTIYPNPSCPNDAAPRHAVSSVHTLTPATNLVEIKPGLPLVEMFKLDQPVSAGSAGI
jgi:hypothetical protein